MTRKTQGIEDGDRVGDKTHTGVGINGRNKLIWCEFTLSGLIDIRVKLCLGPELKQWQPRHARSIVSPRMLYVTGKQLNLEQYSFSCRENKTRMQHELSPAVLAHMLLVFGTWFV